MRHLNRIAAWNNLEQTSAVPKMWHRSQPFRPAVIQLTTHLQLCKFASQHHSHGALPIPTSISPHLKKLRKNLKPIHIQWKIKIAITSKIPTTTPTRRYRETVSMNRWSSGGRFLCSIISVSTLKWNKIFFSYHHHHRIPAELWEPHTAALLVMSSDHDDSGDRGSWK